MPTIVLYILGFLGWILPAASVYVLLTIRLNYDEKFESAEIARIDRRLRALEPKQ